MRTSQWRGAVGLSDLQRMEIEELAAEMKLYGRTQAALARHLGFQDASYVNKILAGTRNIKVQELPKIKEYLERTAPDGPGEHIGNTPDLPPDFDRHGEASEVVEIPEYDVRFSAGPGYQVDQAVVPLRRTWTLPRWLIIDQLGLSPENLILQEVIGDSMSPTLNSGDYVLIDQADRRLGLPGIFGVWDGDALVCKRLERLPGTNPVMVRLKSDNPLHSEYTVPADVVDVKGRLRWVMRRA